MDTYRMTVYTPSGMIWQEIFLWEDEAIDCIGAIVSNGPNGFYHVKIDCGYSCNNNANGWEQVQVIRDYKLEKS